MKNFTYIFFSAMLVNNIVLIKLLGLCPFFSISAAIKTAARLGVIVILVMTLATWLTWLVYHTLLLPLNLVFLRTVIFIVTIALMVQVIEISFKRFFHKLGRDLSIYPSIISTNCLILAVAFLTINSNCSFLQGTAFALGSGFGFALVIIPFAAIREHLDFAPINPSLRGYPVAFLSASLVALAFLGFYGLFGLA